MQRVGAGPERRHELDVAFQVRSAEDVVETLGEMRGALMKVGHLFSYVDDAVPEHVRAVLSQLQDSVAPMAPEHDAAVHERGPVGRIRVFLVDDHRLFRSGVQSELGEEFDIVGSAGDVEAAVRGILASMPDVALLDVHMPGGGGRAVLQAVHSSAPHVRFLALSVSDAPEDVIAVIRAGARGYVTKSIVPAELAAAIRRVHDGDAVFSPRLAGFVLLERGIPKAKVGADLGAAPAGRSDRSAIGKLNAAATGVGDRGRSCQSIVRGGVSSISGIRRGPVGSGDL